MAAMKVYAWNADGRRYVLVAATSWQKAIDAALAVGVNATVRDAKQYGQGHAPSPHNPTHQAAVAEPGTVFLRDTRDGIDAEYKRAAPRR